MYSTSRKKNLKRSNLVIELNKTDIFPQASLHL